MDALSRDALSEVLAAGNEAGSQIAKELIAGGASAIEATNDLVASAQLAADEVGVLAGEKYFGAGVVFAQNVVSGLEAELAKLTPKLMARMGFEEEAYRIQDLFFEGKREEAIAAVPDEFADEISLVGPAGRIKERLELWRNSPVTELLISARDPESLRLAVDLVKG